MEGVILSAVLPTISRDLGPGENHSWVINAYFLTSAAVQPLYGQLADMFGRRWNMLGAVAVFGLGSGICGGATSSTMLIAGRAVQGIGAGGLNMLIDVTICDLVPLRERGTYVGLPFMIVTGRYKPIQLGGMFVVTVCVGSLSVLDASTPTAVWVVLQGLVEAGLGAVISTLLPTIQAGVYARSLSRSWAVAVVFAGMALLATLFEKELKLGTELENEHGLEKKADDVNATENGTL